MSVWVVLERQSDQWHKMSWEALTAGQQVAQALGASLTAVVIGAGVDAAASEAAGKACGEVLQLDHDLLADYTPDAYAAALRHAIEAESPALVLFPHTYQVRDFGPKLATALGKPFLSDVVDIRVEDGRAVFVRQLFQGKINADVVPAQDGVCFASIQSGCFRADALRSADSPAPIRKVEVSLQTDQIRTKPEAPFQEAAGGVDLASAERIVSVGRGIKDPDNIPIARELAEALKAELGASRPICDNGWLPLEHQVGSSGASVSPKLYLALGISGAIQHVVGMKGSQTIVAVNKDESAPIFEIADYGIVGDLFEVVPAIVAALKK